MLPLLVSDLASRYLPAIASGAAFHRRALDAAARGDLVAARRWFDLASERYRRELLLEPLARLRVHQLMLLPGAAAGGTGLDDVLGASGDGVMVEIVRRLNRLDRLEALDSPHELADARSVLAGWIEARGGLGLAAGSVTTATPSAA